jgi:type I restriction enzyme S subunit
MTNTPTYKTFSTNVAWMPQLPDHWKLSRVKNYFSFSNEVVGDDYSGFNVLSLSVNGVIVRDMESGKGKHSMSMDLYQIVKPKSIILCLFDMDVTPRIVGICENLGIITSAYTTIVPKENVCERFYYYFFLHQDYNKSLKAQGTGVRTTLTNNQFGAVKIPIPPFQEQIQIADYLDTQSQKITHFIAKKQQFIALLKEQRQSVINEAVTKGINKKVKLKDSGIKWLGNIPENYQRTSLKRLVKVKITDGPHETPVFVEDGIPFVSAEGAFEGKIDLNKKRGFITKDLHKEFCKKVKPQFGDIFIVKSGSTTGKTVIVDIEDEFNIWSPLALVRTNDLINNYFMLYSLQSEYFQKQVQQNWSYGTQPNIGMGVLERLIVIFPKSLSEQTQIVNHIRTETATIDTAIAKTEREIELIKEYKEAMIAEAVIGKIDISHKLTITTTKKKTVTDEFKEAILISKLVKEFSKPEYPLGRMRYTKLSYLFHRHTDNRTQNYQKKAAGPYNPKTKYAGPEKIAIQNKYIMEQGNGNYKGFVPNDKIADVENYFSHYWSEETFKWLEQFRYKKNDELELYATIDKAIEELKEKSIDPTLENIKSFISDINEWKAKLDREIFSDKNIKKAMDYVNKLFS